MSALTISLVQSPTDWHDAKANRARFEALFEQLPEQGDLVVLPEMFSTGFTMASDTQAEAMAGPTVQWLQAMAARYHRTLCGSVVIRDGNQRFNRLLWVAADGSIATYDKRHRFRMAGEHQHYDAGQERLQVSIKGWSVCPLICYDLRFPVWSRNSGDDYDLLLYVANWPAPRHQAWQTLLAARAIENQAYVAAVNVIGCDGNGQRYAGGTGLWRFDGEPLAHAGAAEQVLSYTIERAPLAAYRTDFPAWQDSDAFTLKPDNPPQP